MRRLILIAAAQLLVFGAVGPSHAADEPSLASILPGIDARGYTLPLTVDQLTPEERATFAGLPPSGILARRFLYTRGYLRFCRLVVENKLAPLQLPDLPTEENWDRQFLSQDESRNVADVALGMKMFAQLRPRDK